VEPSSAPWRVIDSTEAPVAPAEPAPVARGLPLAAVGLVLVAVGIAVAAILVTVREAPVIGVDGAVDVAAGFDTRASSLPVEPADEEVVVDVGGAVVRPGVYRLPPGSRVGDAIVAAGGYGAGVDAALADRQLNLAAVVRDGDEVHVPARGEAGAGPADPGSPGSGAAAGLIDLNAATPEALDTLPGVGPATVAKIVAAREEQPFASVDDLLARKVVGPATLEKLRPLVTAGS
jgi:competence protein ComEA